MRSTQAHHEHIHCTRCGRNADDDGDVDSEDGRGGGDDGDHDEEEKE